ncbi:unnamed protein product [Fusarium graminearum]|nr:unnamed protein product [Fusarium graminearum]
MRSTPVTDTQMMYCNRPIEWTFLGEFEPQQGIASTHIATPTYWHPCPSNVKRHKEQKIR